MAVAPKDDIDRKLAQMYSKKTTVNLDAGRSTMSPEDFWSSMAIIASTNKALINFRTK